MRLILIRHGIAQEIFDAESDEARKLTEEGTKKFKKAAAGIVRAEPKIDRVVSSQLVRAVETAEILLQKLHGKTEKALDKSEEVQLSARIKSNMSLQPEQIPILKPHSPPQEFCAWLRQQNKTNQEQCIAAVGHEPHLSGLCSLLLTGRDENFFEFKKGGAACLELVIRSHDMRATLTWFMKPSLLRDL